MTATNSTATRARGHRYQLNDTVSRLELFPVRPHSGGTPAVVPMRAATEREISFAPSVCFPTSGS